METNAADSGGGDERLGHFERRPDGTHGARMVDVGAKAETAREAVARARVEFPPGLLPGILRDGGPKGPIEEVARVAGVLAAKRTPELIPLCHGLALDHVEVRFEPDGEDALWVVCRAACRGATGVEMEALVGASLAALTVYDMVKGLDHGVRIGGVELVSKSGGRSGRWERAGGA